MPPKNASKGGGNQSKKTEQKKKEKIIEDKTFGLKNKKGAKQQKYIQQVQNQVKQAGQKHAATEKNKEEVKKNKEEKKKELAEINSIFKPVQQLAGKGADPKSVLCAFYKQGTCTKGNKCKFSHDANVERKSEKRSAYVDLRDDKETNENWDEEKLKDVVERKHAKEKNRPTTDIICRYFLDAVEQCKYGWFWECPNGEKCIYRHALPAGYVLKKDTKQTEREDEISLEDLIERERAALGCNTTRVTLETFLQWKRKKIAEREERERLEADKKRNDYKSGKDIGLSGREMFTFNPDLAHGEAEMEEGDESMDIHNIGRDLEDEEEQIEFKEIDMSKLIDVYVPDSECEITVALPDRLQKLQGDFTISEAATNDFAAPAGAEGGDRTMAAEVAIDEELFDGDDDDLDEIDEQLDELAVS